MAFSGHSSSSSAAGSDGKSGVQWLAVSQYRLSRGGRQSSQMGTDGEQKGNREEQRGTEFLTKELNGNAMGGLEGCHGALKLGVGSCWGSVCGCGFLLFAF